MKEAGEFGPVLLSGPQRPPAAPSGPQRSQAGHNGQLAFVFLWILDSKAFLHFCKIFGIFNPLRKEAGEFGLVLPSGPQLAPNGHQRAPAASSGS